MKRIITLTLLSDIGGCLTMLIFFTITDSWGMGVYAGIMSFGNILLPTLGAVFLYLLIKRWTIFQNSILTIIFQGLILFALFIFGLYIWAAIDAIIFETLTWQNIKDDYNSQFSGFEPVAFTEAFLIPTLDLWLTKRRKPAHNIGLP